ncbi:MAG: polyprenyl synthetase family protein, partial [Deltaproteobacteria bacterium]
SELRRGQPTVHKKYGMPLALNAGNWLYFWPLQNVSDWELSSETKLRVYRVCHRGLLRAHFGQALDVGLNIFQVSQDKVKSTSLASLELKSGALMAMALSLGAVLGGASSEFEEACDRFGHAFGIALQMFDDAGNASIEGPKQFEDLLLRRPSWLVATVAEKLTAHQFNEFKENVEKLPEAEPLKKWLHENQVIELARTEAQKYLDESMKLLENPLFEKCIAEKKEISELAQLLVRAYV